MSSRQLGLSRWALAAAVVALVGAIGSMAGAEPREKQTQASAVGVRISIPGVPDVTGGEVNGPPGASTNVTGFAYPDDASVVRLGSADGTVTAKPGNPASAQASADAVAVSLFGGEITADAIFTRATSAAGAVAVTADASASSHVDGLVVLGQPVVVTQGSQVALADWGTLDVLVSRTTTATRKNAARVGMASVTGLRIKLTLDHGGLPAGSEIDLGSADATAVASATPATPSTTQPATASVASGAPPRRHVVEPGASIPGAPPDLVRPLPAGVQSTLTSGGYVFPVYGPASFGDTFGASRPDVKGGWHHGEDIFGPLGTPLLAVAAGTVHTVGWNAIGGWRVWLRDALGNEFYYAHLSAYSPLAADGTQVKAGDVLGFMGKSGDAEFGPPHLHFEIHPAALAALGFDGVVAPYPFLVAWRHAQDVPFAAGRTFAADANGLPRAIAPSPGAVLLQSSDVSRSSGLVPGALGRVLGQRLPGGTLR